MPIRVQSDLPAKEILDQENIFVMDEGQADLQDIRPLEIVILNLMPLKEETELQLLRSLSNTPLQLNITFIAASTHEAKNTTVNHLSDTQGEHGSHVAGIAAANRYIKSGSSYVDALTSVYAVGMAPDAQLLVMKVFGSGGGAYDSASALSYAAHAASR